MDLEWLPPQYNSHMMYVPHQDILFVTKEHALFKELEALKGIENKESLVEGQWYKISISMLRQAYDKHVSL